MVEADKLINQAVIHKSFGKGIIRNVDEKYLEVDFAEKSKAKQENITELEKKEIDYVLGINDIVGQKEG